MNKQSRIPYVFAFILALTLLLGGCSPVPTPVAAPTTAPTLPPTETATKPATATSAPTAVPTIAPTSTPAATATPPATPTLVPTAAPTKPPATTAAPTKPPATTAATASNTAASSATVCLGCHGPFDKLTTASANYLWPNGDKTSPHRYVPHNSKDIPECSNCHKPHPVPPTASDIADAAKANGKWCFTCHHQGVLKCGTCHEP